jgi:hypothetical protein
MMRQAEEVGAQEEGTKETMNFNMLKTTLLLAVMTGLLMLLGQWLGGTTGLVMASRWRWR